MGTTYRKLLQELMSAQAAPYRSDPEKQEAILRALCETMQEMLEKLSRDANEAPGQHT